MTNLYHRPAVLSIIFLLTAISFPRQANATSDNYIGSERCAECHETQYSHFKVSGHPYKLMKAEIARHRPIPLPQGYKWDDISYVIGGAHKKIRFVDNNGYIITAAKDGSELKTQYNLETGLWAFYHKGEKKPYNCGRCHTTGFKNAGNQDGLEGIKGQWAAPGIQCEACHGPGEKHAKTANKAFIKIDRSAAACGQCHSRGKLDSIPAKKGFIRHHEQYNELLASPHKSLTCVTCHDPHKRAQFSIKAQCSSCHIQQQLAYASSKMHAVGITCIDCHMPKAVKSATSKNHREGDIRSHLFTISPTETNMFYNETVKGKTKSVSKHFLTLDFACLSCHKNKTAQWAFQNLKNIHSIGK